MKKINICILKSLFYTLENSALYILYIGIRTIYTTSIHCYTINNLHTKHYEIHSLIDGNIVIAMQMTMAIVYDLYDIQFKYMIYLKAVTGDKYKEKLTFIYIARVVILQ